MKKPSTTIVIDKKLINSKAFFALKVHAIKVLLVFYTKRKMKRQGDSRGNKNWIITNNGEIVFTYKEAENRGFSRKQFRSALDELIDKGFLEITHQGTGPGEPSEYKLTERWQAFDTEHFQTAPIRRKNRSKNMGWSKYNRDRKQKSSAINDTCTGGKNDTSSRTLIPKRVFKTTPGKELFFAAVN